MINVSGHRLGTAEVELALVSHPKVAEAAVVGYPHDIKGQGIYCYVTLIQGNQPSEELKKELVLHVRKEIGPFAAPDQIQFSPGLPKTRSGKIMRRILRKIAEDDFSNLGDTSTLAEPAVVEDLVNNRQNKRAAAGLISRCTQQRGIARSHNRCWLRTDAPPRQLVAIPGRRLPCRRPGFYFAPLIEALLTGRNAGAAAAAQPHDRKICRSVAAGCASVGLCRWG